MFPNNKKVIQIWMQEFLCPSHILTWCPRLNMEWVFPKDDFQPKRKPLFLCSVHTYSHLSCSAEICSIWVAGKRHFNEYAHCIIVLHIVIAIPIRTREKIHFWSSQQDQSGEFLSTYLLLQIIKFWKITKGTIFQFIFSQLLIVDKASFCEDY